MNTDIDKNRIDRGARRMEKRSESLQVLLCKLEKGTNEPILP